MRLRFGIVTAAILLMAGSEPPRLEAREIAPGVYEIPGVRAPGRGPDGNSISFDAPAGLIVVDTGRHVWQSEAILAFARARNRTIAAIVNTHWHLDHASGNVRLRPPIRTRASTPPTPSTARWRRADFSAAITSALVRNRMQAKESRFSAKSAKSSSTRWRNRIF